MQSPPFHRSNSFVRGFSLVEMLITVVIIGIVALLAAGAISKTSLAARSIKCLGQMRTIGGALNEYRVENRNYYPPVEDANGKAWSRDALAKSLPLRPGGLSHEVFICPNARYDGYPNRLELTRTYAAGGGLIGLNKSNSANQKTVPRHLSSIPNPASTVLMCDGRQAGKTAWCQGMILWAQVLIDFAANSAESSTFIDFRHNGKAHFYFADGHIEGMTFSQAKERISSAMWTGVGE